VAERVVLGIVLVACGAIILAAVTAFGMTKERTGVRDLTLGDTHIVVSVVATSAALQKGLSGASPLAPHNGMLFVFEKPGPQPMWMKDMKFSLDILWLDENKQVVHIEEHLASETYPKTFASPHPAKYVLELPSGTVASEHIAIGALAAFSL